MSSDALFSYTNFQKPLLKILDPPLGVSLVYYYYLLLLLISKAHQGQHANVHYKSQIV